MPRHSKAAVVARSLVVAGAVVVVDQLTKVLILNSLSPGRSEQILPGFSLSLVHNRGVAFGLFPEHGSIVTVATLLCLTTLLTYFLIRYQHPALWVAVGLVIGGSLGNLVDRARTGAVIDFLKLPIWPTFNVADVAIVAGICFLLYAAEASGAKNHVSS